MIKSNDKSYDVANFKDSDWELLQEIEDELTNLYCFGTLEKWLEDDLEKTVQGLISSGDATRERLARVLAFNTINWLVKNNKMVID